MNQPHRRLKTKFMSPSNYKGTVRNTTIVVQGRNKIEATKRLRKAFVERGVPSQPSAIEDLLVVEFLGKKKA